MRDSIVVQDPLVLPDRILLQRDMILQGDRIEAINEEPSTRRHHFQWKEGWMSPDLTDIHVHGIDGHDATNGTREAFEAIGRALAKTGTTGYLATTMTATSNELHRVFETMRTFRTSHPQTGSGLLDVHREGPHLHPARIGAQRADAIGSSPLYELQQYRAWLSGDLQGMTLAPETPGADEVVAWATANGICRSAGDCNATYEEPVTAFTAGIRQTTRQFNAMSPTNHRSPGLMGAAPAHPDVQVEMIAGGVHLRPEILHLAPKPKGEDNVLLVTSAMRAMRLTDGVYDLGGQLMTVKNGIFLTGHDRGALEPGFVANLLFYGHSRDKPSYHAGGTGDL